MWKQTSAPGNIYISLTLHKSLTFFPRPWTYFCIFCRLHLSLLLYILYIARKLITVYTVYCTAVHFCIYCI